MTGRSEHAAPRSIAARRARLGLIDLMSREGVDDRTVRVQRLLAEIDLELAGGGERPSGRDAGRSSGGISIRGDAPDALDKPVDLF